jgi:hypothetical protein
MLEFRPGLPPSSAMATRLPDGDCAASPGEIHDLAETVQGVRPTVAALKIPGLRTELRQG